MRYIGPTPLPSKRMIERAMKSSGLEALPSPEFIDIDPEKTGFRAVVDLEQQRQAIVDAYPEYVETMDEKARSFAINESIETTRERNELLWEYEFGASALDKLRENNPDNKLYKLAIGMDIKTGELTFPKFHQSQLLPFVRSLPQFNNVKYNKWTDAKFLDNIVKPQFGELLADEPGYGEIIDKTFVEFFREISTNAPLMAAQTWDTLVWGSDWIAAGIKYPFQPERASKEHTWTSYETDTRRMGPAAKVITAPGRWADKVAQETADYNNFKAKYDPEYQDYGIWVESTPAWGNLDDGKVWGRIIGGIAPSLLLSFGTAGTVNKTGMALKLSDKARKKLVKRAVFWEMSIIEGGGELASGIDWATRDHEISEQEIAKDLEEYKKDYMESFYIVDEGTGKNSFPGVQTLLDEEKPRKTHREMMSTLDGYYKENFKFQAKKYWKKGMSGADALDMVTASALLYAPIAGKLEQMQATRWLDMLPGGWGPKALRSQGYASIGGKLEKTLRRIPGVNKFSKIPNSQFMRILNTAAIEGTEEFSQYFAQTLTSSGLPLTAYKPEYDFDANEAFESFFSGVIGGAGVQTIAGTVNFTGGTDYLTNRNIIKAPPKIGIEYYSKKLDDGTWGLFYSQEGTEFQLRVGDGILKEDKDIFTSFRGANKVVRRYRRQQRGLEHRELLRLHKEVLVDTKVVDLGFNEETGQYEFEIVSKETGERVKLFKQETSLQSKEERRNVERSMKIANDANEKYSDEEIQAQEVIYDSPEALKNQETRKNSIVLKSYLSRIVTGGLSKAEKDLEADLEVEGAFDPANIQNTVLDALLDEEAIENSGVPPQQIVDEIRKDFGDDIANQVSEKLLKEGPPIEEGPPVEEGPPTQQGPPKVTVHAGNVDDYVAFPSVESRDEAHALINGEKVPLTEKEKDAIEAANARAQQQGDYGLAGNLDTRQIAVDIYNRYISEKKDKKSKSKPTPEDQAPPISKAKKPGDMSLQELKAELLKVKARKQNALTTVKVKRIEKEIKKRKGKSTAKATVTAVNKKAFKEKLEKFKDEQGKKMMDNLLQGKDNILEGVQNIDADMVNKAITWVAKQKFMGDAWLDEAAIKLGEVYGILQEREKKAPKEAPKPEVFYEISPTIVGAAILIGLSPYKGGGREAIDPKKEIRLMDYGNVRPNTLNTSEKDFKDMNDMLDAIEKAVAAGKTIHPIPMNQNDASSLESAVLKLNSVLGDFSLGKHRNIRKLNLLDTLIEKTVLKHYKNKESLKVLQGRLDSLKEGLKRTVEATIHKEAPKVSPEILAKRKKAHLDFLEKAKKKPLEELRAIAQANDFPNAKTLSKEQILELLEKKEPSPLPEEVLGEPSERYQRAVELENREVERKREVKKTLKSIQNAIKGKVLLNGQEIKFKYTDKPDIDKKGWYKNGVVTINLAYADESTLFHEIMHPFAESLYVSDEALFNIIYDQLVKDDVGKAVRKKVLGPKKEAPDMIEGVSKLHKNKVRGNLSISRESEVKSIFNEMRKVASLIKNTKNRVKSNSTIDEAEMDYFAGRYGDANAKVEKAIMLLHEQAEFRYPDFKINEDGSIIARMPGFAWDEPGGKGTQQILGKDVSKEVGGWGLDESDPLTKIEILVESIAQVAKDKKPRQTGNLAQAVRRFLRWLKSIFFPKTMHKLEYDITPKTTFRNIADMLTNYQSEEFIPVDYTKDVEAVFEGIGSVARFQPMEISKTTKREANHLFKGAWEDVTSILKKQKLIVDPFDFRTSMVNAIPPGILRDYFSDWFQDKFRDHPDMQIRLKAKGENSGLIANPEDINSHVADIFNDEAIREGLDSLLDEGESDEREVGINEQIWMEELNINLKEGSLKALKRKARNTANFEVFAEKLIPEYTLRRFNELTPRQKAMTMRFYHRINSYIITHQPEGSRNERDSYVVKHVNDYSGKGAVSPRWEISLKDGVNSKTGNQNPYAAKITLHEYNGGKLLISWISSKDYYNVTLNKDKAKDTIKDSYDFFNVSQLFELEREFNKMNLTILFSRGEKRKIGLTRITKTHEKIADNITEYIDREVKNGFIPNSAKFKDEILTPADVAGHEAMKNIWPRYLFDKKGAANIMKRIKIPFTPVTISKDMPEYNFKIFDNSKAQFVDVETGNVQDATIPVKGVGIKYIMDGGSLGSRDLFKRLEKYAGVMKGSGSNKNVIYHTEGMNTIMVKHEMNLAPRDIEIWYNKGQADEQLVARIDKSRNITDAEGNSIDLLMTQDEAKAYDGYGFDAVHTVPGQSMGFISYRDKAPKTSTHGVQWYSYIDDDAIIQAFKDNIMPKLNTQLAEIWNYSVDSRDENGNLISGKSAADKIKKLLVDVLEHTDNEGYRHSMTEHAKLGAGLHQGLEPMLNTIIQNKRMKKTTKVGYQSGSRLKITGNLRGDLKENEVALSRQNAKVVYEAYAKANDISATEASKPKYLKEINKWLGKNEVNITVVRYPVPHAGGLIVARVKRLHSRMGLLEMNPIDIFVKLEGDSDGDEVQIERLGSEHEKIVKDFVRGLNIKGVNLSEYVPKARDKIVFSNAQERHQLMDALAYGETAIGEIANVMNVYGQLARVFDHAIIDGNKIVLKKLNEKVYSKILKKEMPVGEILRTYLQAALDNVEFMLLRDWNYNLNMLYAFLFKRADGKPFKVKKFAEEGSMYNVYEGIRVFHALKALIDVHKIPGRMRAGIDFERGKYDLTDVIQTSDKFLGYTLNRSGYLAENGPLVKHPLGSRGYIENVVFKEDPLTSPWEDIAIAPSRTMNEHIIRHERKGFGDTVFQLNQLLHQNAHLDSVVSLDKIQSSLIDQAYEADVKAGIAKGDKAAYLRLQDRLGGIYRTSMGNAWFQALIKADKIGAQTIDRNDKVVAMTNKYDKEFKELSQTARVIATLKFLKGFINLSNSLKTKKYDKFGKVRVFKALPPASKNKNELQLLDGGILTKFYKEYNKLVSAQGEKTLKSTSKSRNYTATDESIKRICD